LVEEDAAVATMISDFLNQEPGCSLLWVRDYDLALTLLRHDFQPHTIVLDLAFPCTQGLAFHDQLQHDPALAAIPLVVLTSHVSTRIAGRNFAAVLPKPFELSALEQALHLTGAPPGSPANSSSENCAAW
jgi:CheY-like chemotaxis protein